MHRVIAVLQRMIIGNGVRLITVLVQYLHYSPLYRQQNLATLMKFGTPFPE